MKADHLARPLDDEVPRTRLGELLAARWSRRLVMVEAPGGYGKSTALAQAIRANDADPVGVDVHLRCSVDDDDANTLARSMLRALADASTEDDAPVRPRGTAISSLTDAVVDAYAAASPLDVCLHLDDVQRVVGTGATTELLQSVVDHLPRNGHLVLCGRELPPLPLARLRAADDVLEIGADDLAFDEDEIRVLAASHERNGEEPDVPWAVAGWPALVRLALRVGQHAPVEFLIEEVAVDLDDPTRDALTVAVLARRADRALFEEVLGEDGAEQVAGVPLVGIDDTGAVVPHDLWVEAIDRIAAPDARRQIASHVSQWHRRANRIHDAIDVALRAGRHDEALRALQRGLSQGDGDLPVQRLERWRALFDELAPTLLRRPQLAVLDAFRARMIHGVRPGDGEKLEMAARRLAEAGEDAWEGVALSELSMRAWLAGDREAQQRVGDRIQSFARRAPELDTRALVMEAGALDLAGDYAGAMRALDVLDPDELPISGATQLATFRVALAARLGRTDIGRAVAQSVADRPEAGPVAVANLVGARWHDGDPEALRGGTLAPSYGNRRVDFHAAAHTAIMAACRGIAFDVEARGAPPPDRPRDRAMAAIATAAGAVAAGDDSTAAERISRLEDDLDEPQVWGEVLRFPSIPYLYSSAVRERLDDLDVDGGLGPATVRRIRPCRVLLLLRAGGEVVDEPPPIAPILCDLPLRHSVELAVRMHDHHADWSLALTRQLVDYAPDGVRSRLAELVPLPGTRPLGRVVPRSPAGVVEVSVCGPARIRHPDGEEVVPTRQRVRQLLTLLCLQDRVRREVTCELLWPGVDPEKARNNLRVNLSYLRSALEPDRTRGEPSRFVVDEADHLRLRAADALSCDLWDLRAELDAGAAAERRGQGRATRHFRAALDLWTRPVAEDLRSIDDTDGPGAALSLELAALDRELHRRGCQVAERALAVGDLDDVVTVARRLRSASPHDERPLLLLVAAALAGGDLDGAVAARDELLDVLADLGMAPSREADVVLGRLRTRLADAGADRAEPAAKRGNREPGQR